MHVAQYLRLIKPPWIWFHVPNGGKRGRVEAARFKGMGVRAGVPDLVIDHGQGCCYIELKAPKGRQAKSQRDFQGQAETLGSPYRICRSLDEVRSTLKEWGLLNERGMPYLPGRKGVEA